MDKNSHGACSRSPLHSTVDRKVRRGLRRNPRTCLSFMYLEERRSATCTETICYWGRRTKSVRTPWSLRSNGGFVTADIPREVAMPRSRVTCEVTASDAVPVGKHPAVKTSRGVNTGKVTLSFPNWKLYLIHCGATESTGTKFRIEL